MNSFGQGGRIPRLKALSEARGEKRPPGAVSPSARKPAIMQEPVLVLNATFEQLIDHDNPSLGTFSQFYYYSTEFYKGPGSPVVSSTEL